jgi:hypothetical protein
MADRLITAQITGLDQITRRLKDVGDKTAKKILPKAMKKGAVEIKQGMRSAVPVSTDERLVAGLLKAALGEKVKSYRGGVTVAIVGPRSAFKRNKKTKQRERTALGKRALKQGLKRSAGKAADQNPTQYAHLAGPGRKQQFMTQASKATDKARDVIITEVSQGIEEAARG